MLCIAAPIWQSVTAAPLQITAKLDSVQILMGRIATMEVTVVQDKGMQGDFPLLRSARERGFAAVCGDSVEISTRFTRDTVELGSNRIQIKSMVPVQSFDSGYYQLPPLAYAVGTDTVWSAPLNLKVTPVPVTADAEISDFAGVSKPYGSRWTDILPDWIYYYWWAVAGAMLTVAAAVFIIVKRSRRPIPLLSKPKPVTPPHIVAMRRLQALKERKLWEKGMEKEYFTDLTDILRTYLDKRFGINAMEMTSRQIMQTLASYKYIADKKNLMRQVLDMADFVKFAKVRPLPADNVAAWENAVKFVESTSPSEEPPQGNKTAGEPSETKSPAAK